MRLFLVDKYSELRYNTSIDSVITEYEMAFEKRVLELAESVGISNAYFAYGSLFIPFSSISLPAMSELKKFIALYPEYFRGKPRVTLGAEEIAIDFVV